MLKRRLAMLRRESGGKVPATAEVPVDRQGDPKAANNPVTTPAAKLPLAGRLRRHGRQAVAARGPLPDDADLAAALGAQRVRPGLLCVDVRVPLGERHGRVALAGLNDPVTQLDLAEGVAPEGLLFYDTETTGLSGGVGTLAFMIGLARIEGEHLLVRQWMLTSLAAETAMLERAAAWFAQAGACISYNGLSFDLPLLTGRCRLTGVDDHCSTAAQLDLLHPVRRAFAGPWDDCRLATVEQRLLGFRRQDDLPGAEAPTAWLDFLQRGDASRLGAVLRHNHWDLLSLAALLPALEQVYRDPAAHGADLGAIARHWVSQTQPQRALQLLEQHRGRLAATEQRQLAWLHRRQGQWPAAVALWEGLVAQNDPSALEALAKYHEHQRGDFAQALVYARRLPSSVAREHRCARLQARLQRAAVGGRSADPPRSQQRLPLDAVPGATQTRR